ncbi:MAG: acyl-CoA carboxylase epsilon subunit [Oryzihumus sp.]
MAALVAVLAAAAGSAADEPAPRHTSVWAARERLVRAPHVHGRGAWRASAWPR